MLNRPPVEKAFTIMEMIVSIGILVIVILSVGAIFQSAGRTVGVSQASMEMLSSVRSIQQQIEADVSGMDKNAFLVIRGGSFTDPTTGIIRRCDQISFISRGSFANRTGTNSGFTDNNTTVPAAFVWWGQLAIQTTGGDDTSPTNPRSLLNANDPTYKLPLNQVPTGLVDADFILGRHTTLLVPKDASTNNVSPAGTSMGSYPSSVGTPIMAAIDRQNATLVQAMSTSANTEASYDITQSRVSVAQATPTQIMSAVLQNAGVTRSDPNLRYEAEHFCYRYAALRSPYDGTDNSGNLSFINGYFRMHPIALQGVSSFIVEWTDSGAYVAGDTDPVSGKTIETSGSTAALIGTTRWFGVGHAKGAAYNSGIIDPKGTVVSSSSNDDYTADFSYHNRDQWPAALRFRYHIADPTGRLQNGRDFVEVVKLP